MPSIVPLKDGKLQSVLDLNGYSFTNDRGIKRLPQNSGSGQITITSSNIGTFIIAQYTSLTVTLNSGLSGI